MNTTRQILNTLREYQQLERSQARTLPAEFYTDPDFLEFEKEHLFRKQWMCLGRVEEIPQVGDYFVTDLIGEPLLVVRDSDQQIRVMSNVCRHRGMPIAQDSGNASRFICPYHRWSYDLQGQLLHRPFIEQYTDSDLRQCRLPQFNSEIWHGFIYVNLDGSATPLLPRLTGLDPLVKNYHMEQMKVLYSQEQIWETNWKCLTENFMEGYHLSTVHYKTLHSVTPTRLCEHFPPGNGYIGYYSHYPEDYPQRGRCHPDLSETEKRYSVMFCVLPCHVAGTAHHIVSYLCLQPDTVDSVKAKMGVAFYDQGDDQEGVDEAINFFERIMAEDKVQLVNLQRGLKSHYYQPAPLAPADYEGTVWDFYQYMGRILPPA